MIQLGSYDPDVAPADRDAYLKAATAASGLRGDHAAAGSDFLTFASFTPEPQQPMTVADVQRALVALGFFPGGVVDGICGYRTRSAMRLFQEYVRSVEKLPCVPDGRFGPSTREHLQRWLSGGQRPVWDAAIAGWKSGTVTESEYAAWLSLLAAVKSKYLAQPTEMLRLVNAFTGQTDTRKVADWDFAPDAIHLVGIRRSVRTNKFDDLFVLLIKGLVFKFQGSTDPGATTNPLGAPFLVQGQHDFHFGWHKGQQLALRPSDRGVLVVRSKGDFRLDQADVRKGLESNATIHVHWGGKGLTFDVNNWSEGCQVITGSAYIGADGQRVDCSSFVAVNNGEVAANPARTRGAYNVIVDLVLGLGSDLPGNTIGYTLLSDDDLTVGAPAQLVAARQSAMERLQIV
jgi:hypothetical protein